MIRFGLNGLFMLVQPEFTGAVFQKMRGRPEAF
jgi:hypothetical protein